MNINIGSNTCNYCLTEEEEINHILLKCPFANTVLEWVLKWCRLSFLYPDSMENLIDYVTKWENGRKKRKIPTSICYSLWSIQKARNERLYKNRITNPTKVANSIKSNGVYLDQIHEIELSIQMDRLEYLSVFVYLR